MKNKSWNKKDVIRELKSIQKNKQKNVGAKDISPALRSACQRYFGYFNKAKEIAGLEILKPINYKNKLPKSAYMLSKEIAWLIGYILGDGYLTQNNVIGMKTKDNEIKDLFIKNFKLWSNCNHFIIDYKKEKINKFSNGDYTCKPIWSIRVCFREAYLFLEQFKNKPLYSLKYFSREYWKYILKGLWDAEGHISLNRNRIRIGFTNYNKNILKLYKTICSYLNFRYYKHNGQIYICNMLDTIKFVDEIGITIKRKHTIQIQNRIKEIKDLSEIYYKIRRLKKINLKSKEIWEKIDKKIPLGTLYGWLYGKSIPCYINYKLK